MKEAGVDDFEVSAWFGVYAPAGTPPDIVKKLNAAIVKIAATDEVNKLLLEQGAQSVSGTPEDLVAQTKKEMARWKAVVDAAGARQ